MNLNNESQEAIDALFATASQALINQPRKTSIELRALLNGLTLFVSPKANENEIEKVARRIEAANGVRISEAAVLHDDSVMPWLDEAKKTIDPFYWKRYRQLLIGQGLPRDVVNEMDNVTEKILSQMGNPHSGSYWQRKGMVMGHVQSGKTANYTGLLCKAADAGYRLIIVIAGIHNNLRSQTQQRIDEGFIGRDSSGFGKANRREIGVGLLETGRFPVTLTTSLQDFKKTTATTNRSQIDSYKVPVALVIKKNSNTLKNLISWLKENSAEGDALTINQPMLLIDDEADNASINTKYGKDEVTRINGQIRELLQTFHRSCYVGYTATPFANIFIDPDQDHEMLGEDLFPRNFIIGLDAPTNYFGGKKIFIDGIPEDDTESPDYIRYIEDNEAHLPIIHKQHDALDTIPHSLITAIRAFMITRTIRNLRGQEKKHASMLVNASRFTNMQSLLRNRIHEKVNEILDALRINGSRGARGLKDSEIAALQVVWRNEFYNAGFSWSEIQAAMFDAVAAIRVVEVNSRANGLDYSTLGATIIAVGGFSLSRGLTLEGLTITWFLRNTMMYDTLMQMGRWFGYRPDYEDLCRIWMPRAASVWYSHIASATDELHRELKRMEKSRATPMQFGLAVRSHPSALMITARNKVGSGERTVSVGLSNSFVETARLPANNHELDNNHTAALALLDRLTNEGFNIQGTPQVSGGKFLTHIKRELIEPFLLAWNNSDANITTQISPLLTYIDNRADEMDTWDVLIGTKADGVINTTIGHGIIPIERSINTDDLAQDIISLGKHNMRVSSRNVEKLGLTIAQITDAETSYRSNKNLIDNKHINYPGYIYREVRQRPLLALYFVSVKRPDELKVVLPDNFPQEPVVAWAISFPVSTRPDERVEYVINKVKQRELFGQPDDDEDDETEND
ncbi:Z1 domain-containing protein [Pseudochrobactrum sp. B5]|uniref:Z1 domain-containing protein n=1 Tax=Pseudochrobactrum sp. B5 TaxID=1289478 RepID=UPI000952758A|nr:Z1 domain-containing protein [Pseudochrobactrum sp. B5]